MAADIDRPRTERGPRRLQSDGPAADHRSRGRPLQIPEAERRRRLIEAAEQVFLEVGYSDATMHAIAVRAGMSKKTLYQIFPTKESLFAALIADHEETLIAAIDADDGTHSPQERLEDFLRQAAHLLLSPSRIGMHRLVISETLRCPELARAFHREGPGRCKEAVLRWFAMQCARGNLVIDDAEEAAAMLFGMVVGEPHMRLLLCDARPPSQATIDQRVKRAVEIFLKGTSPR